MGRAGKLTPSQAEWIFSRSRDFAKRWAEKPPSCEADWQELMEQARDLMRRGRNHPLLMGIILEVLKCISGEEGAASGRGQRYSRL